MFNPAMLSYLIPLLAPLRSEIVHNLYKCRTHFLLDDYEDEDMENDYVSLKYDVENQQAVEDWKDSILSIDTLAIGPLETDTFEIVDETDNNKDLHDHNLNYNVYDNKEESPLMNVAFFSHELEKEVGANHGIIEEQVIVDIVEINDGDIPKDGCQAFKKRVSLADLLSADSNHKLVKQLGDNELQQAIGSKEVTTAEKPCVDMIKPTFRTKRGLSKVKKLLKEDLSPVKKLNQLMKRVMKKKIHPDLEGKVKQDAEMQPTSIDIGYPTNQDGGSIEQSVS